MRLTGSRADHSDDIFSDWDYQIETSEDFSELRKRIAAAITWRIHDLGPLRLVTLIDDDGVMADFSGAADTYVSEFKALELIASDTQYADYWIFTFKHLKGLFRKFDVLVDIGIEMSTGLARDLYVRECYGLEHYKDFYHYKAIASAFSDDTQMVQATGLPYRNVQERLTKIRALNELMSHHPTSRVLIDVFEKRALLIEER